MSMNAVLFPGLEASEPEFILFFYDMYAKRD